MKFPIVKNKKYQNFQLEVDPSNENLILFDSQENQLGLLSFEELFDYLKDSSAVYQRQEPRIPLSLKIRYTNPEGKWFESITDTIGGGGLFIESRTPFEPGSPIKVELFLPGKEKTPITAEGTVAWKRTKFERTLYFPGMGIQFTNVSSENKDALLSEIDLLNSLRGVKEDPMKNIPEPS